MLRSNEAPGGQLDEGSVWRDMMPAQHNEPPNE